MILQSNFTNMIKNDNRKGPKSFQFQNVVCLYRAFNITRDVCRGDDSSLPVDSVSCTVLQYTYNFTDIDVL